MAGVEPKIWQENLDFLTRKAKDDGSLDRFTKANGFLDKIKKIQEMPLPRRKIASWISKCAETKFEKNGWKASKLREEGNKKFKAKEYTAARKLYTDAIITAPKNAQELGLAYANRSAALYFEGHYKRCLNDIQRALVHNYPVASHYKVYQRAGNCYNSLKQFQQAIEFFQMAIEALDEVPKMSEVEKSKKIKELNVLLSNSEKFRENPNLVDSNEDSEEEYARNVLPPVFEVQDKRLPGANKFLRLEASKDKGRHVITERKLIGGEVLFSELPYSSVLLPPHYSTHCHYCYMVLDDPIPCYETTQARYCSEDCRQKSWDQYQKYECKNLELCHSVGVAHLAMRTVILLGMDKIDKLRPALEKSENLNLATSHSLAQDPYVNVLHLVEHSKTTHPEDMFQYAVTASLLAMFLETRTDFFKTSVLASNAETASLKCKEPKETSDEDEKRTDMVAALIFKHILQLVCNASAIYEVGDEHTDSEDTLCEVLSTRQYRIATAIYPGASMMNHSCDPSVINSFQGRRIVVKAVKEAKAGSEISNCYGPHFRHHFREERQNTLANQYGFECTCTRCENVSTDAMFHHQFEAFKCRHCPGPITREGRCHNCFRIREDVGSTLRGMYEVDRRFQEAENLERIGQFVRALDLINGAKDIADKILFKFHQRRCEIYDLRAKYCSMLHRFDDAVASMKEAITIVKVRYGDMSIEVGHEMYKLYTILHRDFTLMTPDEEQKDKKVGKIFSCLYETLAIMKYNYGEWHKLTKELQRKANGHFNCIEGHPEMNEEIGELKQSEQLIL